MLMHTGEWSGGKKRWIGMCKKNVDACILSLNFLFKILKLCQ